MSNDTRYNGWTNYETWNLALWLDNDQGYYTYWHAQAQKAWNTAEDKQPNPYLDRDGNARMLLSDQLCQEIEDAQPELIEFWADMITAALGEIDWLEIADHYLSDVNKAEDANA